MLCVVLCFRQATVPLPWRPGERPNCAAKVLLRAGRPRQSDVQSWLRDSRAAGHLETNVPSRRCVVRADPKLRRLHAGVSCNSIEPDECACSKFLHSRRVDAFVHHHNMYIRQLCESGRVIGAPVAHRGSRDIALWRFLFRSRYVASPNNVWSLVFLGIAAIKTCVAVIFYVHDICFSQVFFFNCNCIHFNTYLNMRADLIFFQNYNFFKQKFSF